MGAAKISAPPSRSSTHKTIGVIGTNAAATAYRGSRAQYVRQRAVTAPTGRRGQPVEPAQAVAACRRPPVCGGLTSAVRERLDQTTADEREHADRDAACPAAGPTHARPRRPGTAQGAPNGVHARTSAIAVEVLGARADARREAARAAARRATQRHDRERRHRLPDPSPTHERLRRRRRRTRADDRERQPDRRGDQPDEQRERVPPPDDADREGRDRRHDAGHADHAADREAHQERAARHRERHEPRGVERRVHAERDERDDPPCEHHDRADQHRHGGADLAVPDAERDHPRHDAATRTIRP